MGKLLNNYFYGKAGQADYTPDDLPKNRMQLFWEMLRIRFSALMRLNLLYMLVWIPAMLVILYAGTTMLQTISYTDDERAGQVETIQVGEDQYTEVTYTTIAEARDITYTISFWTLLLLIPCIGLTGPFTAGISYVCRNWSRDQHAEVWSDYKDAVKENWKQSLVISLITGAIPFLVFFCYNFYGNMVQTSGMLLMIPQILIVVLGIIWSLAVTYMYPLIVSYELRLRDVIRNALLIAVARLPISVGLRLLYTLPLIIFILVILLTGNMVFILLPFVYYILLGFGLSRFITASYTNGVFDKYINSRIEGVEINRGLAKELDDDDEMDEEKPAE